MQRRAGKVAATLVKFGKECDCDEVQGRRIEKQGVSATLLMISLSVQSIQRLVDVLPPTDQVLWGARLYGQLFDS